MRTGRPAELSRRMPRGCRSDGRWSGRRRPGRRQPAHTAAVQRPRGSARPVRPPAPRPGEPCQDRGRPAASATEPELRISPGQGRLADRLQQQDRTGLRDHLPTVSLDTDTWVRRDRLSHLESALFLAANRTLSKSYRCRSRALSVFLISAWDSAARESARLAGGTALCGARIHATLRHPLLLHAHRTPGARLHTALRHPLLLHAHRTPGARLHTALRHPLLLHAHRTPGARLHTALRHPLLLHAHRTPGARLHTALRHPLLLHAHRSGRGITSVRPCHLTHPSSAIRIPVRHKRRGFAP
ncbi:hypothetical protein QFZ63_000498 [Streptomyces sp. B3I7]|nr:hypothetical protein [Streptomyces sp. B3I7]